MGLVAKLHRVNSIEKKYANFDASSLFYDKIHPASLDLHKDLFEMISIISWLAACKTCGVEYSEALAHATRVKELLHLANDEINEREDQLETIKQRLEDEGESDEEFFKRNYCRPVPEDEDEAESE